LTEDTAAHNGYISEGAEQFALCILTQLKEDAFAAAVKAGKNGVQFAGIATAMFRKAPNGLEILQKFGKRLGINFHILSQEEEGVLGFMTAKALYPEIPEGQIVAWDNGSGSFQLTSKEGEHFNVYRGPLGYGTVRVLLSTEVRNGPPFLPNQSGNPISRTEASALAQKIFPLLPIIPEWLTEAIANKEITFVTFGEGKSISAIMAKAQAIYNGLPLPVEDAVLTIHDFETLTDAFLEQEDEYFNSIGLYPWTSSVSIYLTAVLEYLGIETVHYRRSIGNTPGMMVSPQFWCAGPSANP
jgi:exopolyphosphatase/pppGpp-phosphohydrolase